MVDLRSQGAAVRYYAAEAGRVAAPLSPKISDLGAFESTYEVLRMSKDDILGEKVCVFRNVFA